MSYLFSKSWERAPSVPHTLGLTRVIRTDVLDAGLEQDTLQSYVLFG